MLRNWGCNDKMQTQVAWTCGTQGRSEYVTACSRMVVEGILQLARLADVRLLGFVPRDVQDHLKSRAIGQLKTNLSVSGRP